MALLMLLLLGRRLHADGCEQNSPYRLSDPNRAELTSDLAPACG
jgi:hypothetical protein